MSDPLMILSDSVQASHTASLLFLTWNLKLLSFQMSPREIRQLESLYGRFESLLPRLSVPAGEDVDDMDDGKSSNKYGVTYTSSGTSGISFNYSDLWK